MVFNHLVHFLVHLLVQECFMHHVTRHGIASSVASLDFHVNQFA